MSSRRAVWLGVAVLLAMIACDPRTFPDRAYHEEFETLCEGTPCGWEISRGEPGQATWITSLHPGEHALRLTGDVTVRGPGAGPDATDVLQSTGAIGHVASRCDPGSRLQVTVLVVDRAGIPTRTTFEVPSGDWSELALGLAFDNPIVDARVTAIVIEKTGVGSCDVAEIVLDQGGVDDIGC